MESSDVVAYTYNFYCYSLSRPIMENSDVVVTYLDNVDGSYHAVDYSITNKAPVSTKYQIRSLKETHSKFSFWYSSYL